MASNGVDATTGAPRFPESDAPQTGADYEEVADFAATVGTRLIGTTTERNAYAYAREGLCWYDTTLDQEFIYTGSGWVSVWQDTGWVTVSSYSTGWAAFGGGEAARWRVRNGVLHVHGRVSGDGSSGATIFNVPAPYRHTLPVNQFVVSGSYTLDVTPSGDVRCVVPASGARGGVVLAFSIPVG